MSKLKKWYDLSRKERIKVIRKGRAKGLSWAKLAVKVGLKPHNKSTVYQFADRISELNYLFPKKVTNIISQVHQPSISAGGIPPPPPKRGILPPPPPPKIKPRANLSQKPVGAVTESDFTLKYIEWRTAQSRKRYNSLPKSNTDVKSEPLKAQSEASENPETVYPKTYDMNELNERMQQRRLHLEQSLDDSNRLAGEAGDVS